MSERALLVRVSQDTGTDFVETEVEAVLVIVDDEWLKRNRPRRQAMLQAVANETDLYVHVYWESQWYLREIPSDWRVDGKAFDWQLDDDENAYGEWLDTGWGWLDVVPDIGALLDRELANTDCETIVFTFDDEVRWEACDGCRISSWNVPCQQLFTALEDGDGE